MAIDLTDNEPKLSLTQAAKYFPEFRPGKAAHKSRILRYILDGIVSPLDGERKYLDALKAGSQWMTTPSAIQEFCESITPGRGRRSATVRTSAGRSRSAEQTARALDRAGIR